MCRSVVYAANTVEQDLAANDTINFGHVVKRYGKNLTVSGGNVVFRGIGYYDVDVNVSFVAGGTGANVFTISLLKNGIPIQGAVATLSATAGNNYTVCIPAAVSTTCCAESTITAVIDTPATVINAAIVVDKI